MFSSLPYGYLSLYVLVSGTLLSISSSHWFSVWAGLEVNLIGFLPMLVYQKGTFVSESAVKYFVVQALGSALLIIGSLVSGGVSFGWDLSEADLYCVSGLSVVIMSLVMKMGGFPFHFWLPSVMAGLNWLCCLVLTTWQKIAPLFMVCFFLSVSSCEELILVLCVVSAASSIVGGVGGVNQTQVRSLLAYSSISHLGWMVFGLMHSYEVMKLYFGIYMLISLCVFLSLWGAESSSFKNMSSVVKSKSYSGLILVWLLSLAGLPPLLGFVAKWGVIMVSASSGLWGLNFILILGSLLSIFYYLSLFMYGGFSLSEGMMVGRWVKVGGLMALGVIVNLSGGLVLIMGGMFT